MVSQFRHLEKNRHSLSRLQLKRMVSILSLALVAFLSASVLPRYSLASNGRSSASSCQNAFAKRRPISTLVSKLFESVGGVRPVHSEESSRYFLSDLPNQDVPINLNEIYRRFTEGLEPRLEDPQQLTLFRSYLLSRFHGADSKAVDQGLQRLRTILNKQKTSFRKIPFSKVLFSREEIQQLQSTKPIPKEMSEWLVGVKKRLTGTLDKFTHVETHLDYWLQVFHLPEPEGGWEVLLGSEADSRGENGMPETSGLRRKRIKQIKINALSRYISPDFRARLRRRDVDLEKSLQSLIGRVLMPAIVKIEPRGGDVRKLRQAVLDAMTVIAFSKSQLFYRDLNSDPGVLLDDLDKILRYRDRVAKLSGFNDYSHAVEALWLEGDRIQGTSEDWKGVLKRLRQIVYETGKKSQLIRSFVVRPLSISEAGFRGILGNDCSTDQYFDLALDNRLHYFTMTDKNYGSSGQVTIALGNIRSGHQSLPTAFVDKVQGVDLDVLPKFLEAVRRIVKRRGYDLAFRAFDHDWFSVNGLSSHAEITHKIFTTFPLESSPIGAFVSDGDHQGYRLGFSRAEGGFTVLRLMSQNFGEEFKMKSLEARPPFRQGNFVDAANVVTEELRLANGTNEEQVRFFNFMSGFLELNLLTIQELKILIEERMRNPLVPQRLKNQIFVNWLGLKNAIGPNEKLQFSLKMIEWMSAQEALQTLNQIVQTKELYDGFDKVLEIAFLSKKPERLIDELQAKSTREMFYLFERLSQMDRPYFSEARNLLWSLLSDGQPRSVLFLLGEMMRTGMGVHRVVKNLILNSNFETDELGRILVWVIDGPPSGILQIEIIKSYLRGRRDSAKVSNYLMDHSTHYRKLSRGDDFESYYQLAQ